METLYIGSSPCEEECAQVGADNYDERAKKECRVFIGQLWRHIEKEKGLTPSQVSDNFYLVIKRNLHDYGIYYEVVVKADEDDEAAINLAYWVEGNTPSKWDEESKKELGL